MNHDHRWFHAPEDPLSDDFFNSLREQDASLSTDQRYDQPIINQPVSEVKVG